MKSILDSILDALRSLRDCPQKSTEPLQLRCDIDVLCDLVTELTKEVQHHQQSVSERIDGLHKRTIGLMQIGS